MMCGPENDFNDASTINEEIPLSSHEGNYDSSYLAWGHGPETPEQVVTRLVASTTEWTLRKRLKRGVPVALFQHGSYDNLPPMFCMATHASSRMEPIRLSHVIPRTTDHSVVRPHFSFLSQY